MVERGEESKAGLGECQRTAGLQEPPGWLPQAIREGSGDGQSWTVLEALGICPASFCLMNCFNGTISLAKS